MCYPIGHFVPVEFCPLRVLGEGEFGSSWKNNNKKRLEKASQPLEYFHSRFVRLLPLSFCKTYKYSTCEKEHYMIVFCLFNSLGLTFWPTVRSSPPSGPRCRRSSGSPRFSAPASCRRAGEAKKKKRKNV